MHFRPTSFGPADEAVPRLRPGTWLVEAGSRPPPAHAPSRLLAGLGAEAGMALTLTSMRLLRLDLGTALVERLAGEGCRLADPAALCLHEILLNAAIHGNLEVASGRATDWADLTSRDAAIAAALTDPRRAGRLVTVALGWDTARAVVAIADEGRGYHPFAPAPGSPDRPPVPTRRGAGRGLAIARASAEVEVRDGGRCTRLLFRRLVVPTSP